MRFRIFFAIAASIPLIWFSFQASPPVARAAEPDAEVRFNRDIRSILTDKCFACHGPDAETVEGGLRLDLPEEALGTAIDPGNAAESELIRRIRSTDPYEVMPPPEMHKSLSQKEIELLTRWIDQGAAYQAHWAYEPLREADDAAGELNATQLIDHLIEKRLRHESVTPAEPADPVTLVRRLSFDLTGLPPTPEDVEAFVQDPSEDAYAALVDRLLGSPRYGERMAVYWLDLVRYADTVGYHGDQNVSQSPYRDYVINAFNNNLPYDQFIREQLAGDLLPNATLDQQVASGYNRLNQTTEEGGSQAKEYLAIYFADRVRNVSQVFMGATMGCAQCHDHKYDPYTMRDFYSLGAFFADLEERGVYSARQRPPMLAVPDQELRARLDQMDQDIASLKAQVDPLRERLRGQQNQWEFESLERLGQNEDTRIDLVDDVMPVDAKQSGDWKFVSKGAGEPHRGKTYRRQQAKGLVQHYFIDSKQPVEVDQATRFEGWVYLDPKNPPAAVMLQFNDGDWNHRKVWGSDDITFGRQPESHDAYRRGGDLPEPGKWVRLQVDAAEVGLKPGTAVNGIAFTQFGGLAFWDDVAAIKRTAVPLSIANALRTPKEQRTEEQAAQLTDYYLSNAPEITELNDKIAQRHADRQQAYDSATQTVVSRSVTPRTIRILPRGNWMDDSGDIVGPAIPDFLGNLETGQERPTRLDLANWLCDADNPLTSRTMVNRLWALMFGRGICTSVDDLGGQGTYPSYPDLLDTLALEFVRSGWDIKHILRSIVLSNAYRRSSRPSERLLANDPYNDLFARQGRYCVDAEVVRDTALAVSGLLVEKVGGPSVHPYQPAGYYAQLNFPRREYAADEGSNQYRRGVYTHWQRTFLHPMLKAFDAPSREECTAQRTRSNTPLQALVLLNDPSFIEAARAFAERIIREGGPDVNDRVSWAYRQAVSCPPEPAVAAVLGDVYAKHLQQYQDDPEAAKALVAHGQFPVPDDVPLAELAAWTSVARVVLNLHETITRY